ncbi:MAG: hypothetical protein ACRDGB_15105, partial [Candidatus Limnocylindria bacterium]
MTTVDGLVDRVLVTTAAEEADELIEALLRVALTPVLVPTVVIKAPAGPWHAGRCGAAPPPLRLGDRNERHQCPHAGGGGRARVPS